MTGLKPSDPPESLTKTKCTCKKCHRHLVLQLDTYSDTTDPSGIQIRVEGTEIVPENILRGWHYGFDTY